jgi:hypothetical protein
MNTGDDGRVLNKRKIQFNVQKYKLNHNNNTTTVTAMKLISKYADSYNVLTRENESLKNEIKVLKQNIRINKDIINYFYSNNNSNNENNQHKIIQILKYNNEMLLQENEKLISDKFEIEKKVRLI